MMAERQIRGVPTPSVVRPGIPREIDALVQKMGAKDPHERFQTAAEVVAALHPWLPVAQWAALGLPSVSVATPAPRQSGAGRAAGTKGFWARLFGRFAGK